MSSPRSSKETQQVLCNVLHVANTMSDTQKRAPILRWLSLYKASTAKTWHLLKLMTSIRGQGYCLLRPRTPFCLSCTQKDHFSQQSNYCGRTDTCVGNRGHVKRRCAQVSGNQKDGTPFPIPFFHNVISMPCIFMFLSSEVLLALSQKLVRSSSEKTSTSY